MERRWLWLVLLLPGGLLLWWLLRRRARTPRGHVYIERIDVGPVRPSDPDGLTRRGDLPADGGVYELDAPLPDGTTTVVLFNEDLAPEEALTYEQARDRAVQLYRDLGDPRRHIVYGAG